MSKLKPGTNEGFPKVAPGMVLLEITEVEWLKYEEGDNAGETYSVLKLQIVDSEVEENIGKNMQDRFNHFESKGEYWGVINFLGILWKAGDKTLEVGGDYFLEAKNQKNATKLLTGKQYGATAVVTKDKKSDKEYTNLRSYMTKDEYKTAVKDAKKANKAAKKDKPDTSGGDDGGDDDSGDWD